MFALDWIHLALTAIAVLMAVAIYRLVILRINAQVRVQMLQDQLNHLNLNHQALTEQYQCAQAKIQELSLALVHKEAVKQTEQSQYESQLQWLQDAKQNLKHEFQVLADNILQQKAELTSKQHQDQLKFLLQPFREQLTNFRQKIEDTYTQENRERYALLVEIQQLKQLNQQMSTEATNLTKALKGDKKLQGHWGEIILERLLENSGLRKGIEYEVQVALQSQEGKKQIPDVIIRLPENKDIVIDAKVTLNAYEAYVNVEDQSLKDQYLKQFLRALRNHVELLSGKHYEHLPSLRTLDFVFMFVPIEPAFLLAVEQDSRLFADAYDHNIVLVSPSTLLATLRTVQSIWRYEHQNRNAEQLSEVAGGLYDQCVRFLESFESLGKQINKAQEYYDKAANQLTRGRGNLIHRVDQLDKLGARVKKSLQTRWLSESVDV